MKIKSIVTKETIITICNRVIDWSVWLILILVPGYFAFFQENFNIFELNKELVLVTLLSLAWSAVLVRMALRKTIRIQGNAKLWWMLGTLLALIIFNALIALDLTASFFGSYMRLQGSLIFIYYWLWMILLLIYLRDKSQIKASLIAVALGATPVLLYALAQRFGYDPLVWGESGMSRAFSSLGQPNFLGAYVAMGLFLTGALLITIKQRIVQALVGILLLMQLAVLVFTYSRSAWLAVISGLVLIGFLILLKRRLFKLTISLILIIVVSISTLVVFNQELSRQNLFQQNRIAQLFLSSFNVRTDGGSSKARMNIWQSGWLIYRDSSVYRQLVGYGKESQAQLYVRHYAINWAYYERINSFADRAHNIILDTLLEYGLLGLIIFAGLNIFIFWSAVTFYFYSPDLTAGRQALLLLAGAMAYFVANLFGFSMTTHYVYYYFLLMILYVISNVDQVREFKITFSAILLWPLIMSLIIFNALIVWQNYYAFIIADHYLIQAKRAEAKLDCQNSLNNINQVFRWMPTVGFFKEQYLMMYINCLPSNKGHADFSKLIENIQIQLENINQPERDYGILNGVANTYSQLGQYVDSKYYNQADYYYQQLLVMSPNLLISHYNYGRMKIWAGDNESAIRILNEALTKAPDYSNAEALGYRTDGRNFILTIRASLADAYFNVKDYRLALENYLIIAEYVDNADISIKISDTYCALKNEVKCQEYFQMALTKTPDSPEAKIRLAEYFLAKKNYEQAWVNADAVLRVDKANIRAKKVMTELEKINQ